MDVLIPSDRPSPDSFNLNTIFNPEHSDTPLPRSFSRPLNVRLGRERRKKKRKKERRFHPRVNSPHVLLHQRPTFFKHSSSFYLSTNVVAENVSSASTSLLVLTRSRSRYEERQGKRKVSLCHSRIVSALKRLVDFPGKTYISVRN